MDKVAKMRNNEKSDFLNIRNVEQHEEMRKSLNTNYDRWHKDAKDEDMDTWAALLEDQKRANELMQSGARPQQMRWHPLVIRFALGQARSNTKRGYEHLSKAMALPST